MVHAFFYVFHRFVVVGAAAKRKTTDHILCCYRYCGRMLFTNWSVVFFEQNLGISAILFCRLLLSKILDGKADSLEKPEGVEISRRGCGWVSRCIFGTPNAIGKNPNHIRCGNFSFMGKYRIH